MITSGAGPPGPSGPRGSSGARRRRQWQRALATHRRLLGAGLAAAAVAVGLGALAPEPPPSAAVLVAATDLVAGQPLSAEDVRMARYPSEGVPDGALSAPDQATGRTLAAPARRGEPLTDVRFLGPGLLAGADDGLVAAPVRVADPGIAGLVRAGDRVDVLAAETAVGQGSVSVPAARSVARAVRVLAVPASDASGGFTEGGLVVVATTPAVAVDLARAAVTARLTLTLLGDD